VIEQHIDLVGTSSVKLMRSLDGGKHRLRIETPEHVHRAAASGGRQHFGAGDMADRRHREIARRIRDLEIGEMAVAKPDNWW
jgi:hypothetical protein